MLYRAVLYSLRGSVDIESSSETIYFYILLWESLSVFDVVLARMVYICGSVQNFYNYNIITLVNFLSIDYHEFCQQ